MRSGAILLFAAALGAGAVCVARDAHALGPIGLELGAKVGGGTNPFSSQPNPLGLGLGGRAGVTFLGYYGGLSVMYYVGGKTTPGGVENSEHALLYGVEGGYGIKFLDLLTIRGQVGVGNFTVSRTSYADLNNLYLEPGVTALLSFGLLFVGADANLLVLPSATDPGNPLASSSWATAFTVHGQVGVNF
jgi:hypothetical protein